MTQPGQPARFGQSTRLIPALRELVLLVTLFLIYRAARLITADDVQQAMTNAQLVAKMERLLRLPDEAAVQAWLLNFPDLLHFANHYYVMVHFPVTAAFLIWGYLWRPREQYLWARRLIVTQTLLALALQLVVPLAPPRMLPRFVDTMATIGPSAYEGSAAQLANQYAAMPSLHIGWAALIAVVVWRTARWWPIRWLAVAHAVTTVFVVIATANHWWLDGLVAGLLLAFALALHQMPSGSAHPVAATAAGSPRDRSRPVHHSAPVPQPREAPRPRRSVDETTTPTLRAFPEPDRGSAVDSRCPNADSKAGDTGAGVRRPRGSDHGRAVVGTDRLDGPGSP